MNVRTLCNGITIPTIALGTISIGYKANVAGRLNKTLVGKVFRKIDQMFFHSAEKAFERSIQNAISTGYRLIDTSAAYQNEHYIQQAIKKSNVNRAEMFLTGRISNYAQFGGIDSVRRQIKAMLENSGENQIDLLMFHWPVTGHFEDTWKVICEAYDSGIARSIGVANCNIHHIERLMKCGYKPMLNQFELHPLFVQNQLIEYCRSNDIMIESYSAIARFDDRLFRLPKLHAIAKRYNKTPAQVVLRWHIQHGFIPVVRSTNPIRQRENIDIFDFNLSHEEMETIDSFNINARIRYDPDNCDFSIL